MLESLSIAYPVGRSGARFEARLPTAVLRNIDTTRLRFFVVEDDTGERYPAVIDQLVGPAPDSTSSTICGAVVAHG